MSEARTYTAQEKKRLENVEQLTSQLAEQGYQRIDQTISIEKANGYALILLLVLYPIFHGLFFLRNDLHFDFHWIDGFGFFALMFVGIVVHELIHGFCWGLFAPSHWKTVEFGVIWKMITPYCTCGEPLQKWQYIVGAAMPGILTGLLPTVYGIFADSLFWLELGLILLIGAAGDALIIWKMLRYRSEKQEIVLLDHPTECGFIVFEK